MSMPHPSVPRGTAVVLGAGTAVGGEVLRLLGAAGFRRVVACGRTQPAAGGPHEWRRIDLAAPEAADRLSDLAPDVVVSAAPVFVAARALAAAIARSGVRVSACSSMSVLSKESSPDRRERAVAASLRDAESTLLESAGAGGVAILRPTMIWGSGRDANVGALVRFARRFRFLPAPGPPTGLRQPVHFADVAACAVAAALAPPSGAATFELGGGERLSATELVERVALACGVRCMTLPAATWRALGAVGACIPGLPAAGAAHRLAQDQLADNAAACRAFGVRPRGFIHAGDLA